ncbi:hypothetical protein ABZ611_07945 [Streptomyces sp. NPDC007861]|uniref:hypothetical protein n=1 Tax=Streptomyces sp. NPDC007861 TaxID=3154893 RepID=UPI003407FFD0
MRPRLSLAAAVLCLAAALTACGPAGGSASTSPDEVAEMQKLVDSAESAAAQAESAVAEDD